MNKREEKELLADKEYWMEVTKVIPGWELFGWTYRDKATFITKNHYQPATAHDTLYLTGLQRDELLESFQNHKKSRPLPKKS